MPRTKHPFWGRRFWGSYEHSQENVDFVATKFAEVSREMIVLRLQHVWSWFSGFLVASPCLWWKLHNISFSKVSTQVLMSFCVARVAFSDCLTCLKKCRKSFCVTGAILLQGFQKMTCIFSTQAQFFGRVHFHFAWQAQHFRQVVLRVESVILCGRHSMWWRSVVCAMLFCVAGAVFGTHYSYTLRFTLYTLRVTLHTPHYKLYTLHLALRTLRFTHSTLYTLLFTL